MRTLYVLGFTLTASILFNGCASKATVDQLRYENHRQLLVIQKQKEIIGKLKKKIDTLQAKHSHTKITPEQQTHIMQGSDPKKRQTQKPKKNIKLKKVEDHNYSHEYMYPDTAKKSKKTAKPKTTATKSATMSKQACISMIGQAKFDRYTQMFGSESAAIKRCALMRSLRR